MRLTLVLALSATAITSAFHAPSLASRIHRVPAKRFATACRLGDLSGERSRRIDRRGRISETTPAGKHVTRDFSTSALGKYDDLDLDLADVQELPSWWIIRAEEAYRAEQIAAREPDVPSY
ncbi:hypothetical protein KFE25_005171 [Diacronema lutheri]|uniref:Uncharacterized protein n=2 Tax=Diacronema lutheri TaxID=2081491 RepID=A0A8J5X5J4_DIALT|nr:hypothetical protein KFE25_005171 [Diacronema lutheri]